MKHMIALIVCFILSSFAAAAQTEWVTFSSPEGRFSLQFPEKPTLEVKHAIADKPTMYSFTAKSRTIGALLPMQIIACPTADNSQHLITYATR